MKGLFWCQTLKGIGHLNRSLALCQGLIHDFDITFIHGGPNFNNSIDSPNFHFVSASPLLARDKRRMWIPNQRLQLAQVLKSRLDLFKKICETPFDFFISEYFPFERRYFYRHEVLSIIRMVKKANPKCLIICSFRDIMDDISLSWQQDIADIINKYFDFVLIHSDPNFIKLEDTFSLTYQIKDKLIYTGYVVKQNQVQPILPRKKQILISIGGGSFGEELMIAVAKVAHFFPDYNFLFSLGPLTKDKLRYEMLNQQKFAFNIQIKEFIQNFDEALQECALSISLTGYNTVMGLVKNKTPGILYPPRGLSNEQELRARKFDSSGIFKMIYESDLTTSKLRKIINDALSKPYPNFNVDLSGAQKTPEIILNLLKNIR